MKIWNCCTFSLNCGFEAVLSDAVSLDVKRGLVCTSWCAHVAVMIAVKAITRGLEASGLWLRLYYTNLQGGNYTVSTLPR